LARSYPATLRASRNSSLSYAACATHIHIHAHHSRTSLDCVTLSLMAEQHYRKMGLSYVACIKHGTPALHSTHDWRQHNIHSGLSYAACNTQTAGYGP
jgi:hypothetical protein